MMIGIFLHNITLKQLINVMILLPYNIFNHAHSRVILPLFFILILKTKYIWDN
jgi:hypothetical protein